MSCAASHGRFPSSVRQPPRHTRRHPRSKRAGQLRHEAARFSSNQSQIPFTVQSNQASASIARMIAFAISNVPTAVGSLRSCFKSYVTSLPSSITFATALSSFPRRPGFSQMVEHQHTRENKSRGVHLYRPLYLGAEPCVASNTAPPSPIFAPGTTPNPPTSPRTSPTQCRGRGSATPSRRKALVFAPVACTCYQQCDLRTQCRRMPWPSRADFEE